MKVWRIDGREEQICDVCGGAKKPMMLVHKTTETHQVLGYVCEEHVDPSILPWKLEEDAWKIIRAIESIAILVGHSEFNNKNEKEVN